MTPHELAIRAPGMLDVLPFGRDGMGEPDGLPVDIVARWSEICMLSVTDEYEFGRVVDAQVVPDDYAREMFELLSSHLDALQKISGANIAAFNALIAWEFLYRFLSGEKFNDGMWG